MSEKLARNETVRSSLGFWLGFGFQGLSGLIEAYPLLSFFLFFLLVPSIAGFGSVRVGIVVGPGVCGTVAPLVPLFPIRS